MKNGKRGVVRSGAVRPDVNSERCKARQGKASNKRGPKRLEVPNPNVFGNRALWFPSLAPLNVYFLIQICLFSHPSAKCGTRKLEKRQSNKATVTKPIPVIHFRQLTRSSLRKKIVFVLYRHPHRFTVNFKRSGQ